MSKPSGITRSTPEVIPQAVIEKLNKHVTPHIVEACHRALQAYEMAEPYGDQYVLGTFVFGTIANRLRYALSSTEVTIDEIANDIVVKVVNEGHTYSFRVHRVDTQTRVPRGGKRVKQAAVESKVLFLSKDIEEICLDYRRSSLIIAYDVNIADGLGTISIERIYPTAKKTEFNAIRLATLYATEELIQVMATETQPEPIAHPIVLRDVPAQAKRAMSQKNE